MDCSYPLPQPVVVLAITRHGLALAGRTLSALPAARLFAPDKLCADSQAVALDRAVCFSGSTSEQIGPLFAEFEAIVAIFSLGILVRIIAPHLRDKTRGPAVVVLDEADRFAIPVLSGHLGGANALALHLGSALGAAPVLTIASDARETLAVDLLGRELGWTLEADKQALIAASAAVVNDEPVAMVQEAGVRDWWHGHAGGRTGPLPENIRVLPRIEDLDTGRYSALLWISQRPVEALGPVRRSAFSRRLILYRPPRMEDR